MMIIDSDLLFWATHTTSWS